MKLCGVTIQIKHLWQIFFYSAFYFLGFYKKKFHFLVIFYLATIRGERVIQENNGKRCKTCLLV